MPLRNIVRLIFHRQHVDGRTPRSARLVYVNRLLLAATLLLDAYVIMVPFIPVIAAQPKHFTSSQASQYIHAKTTQNPAAPRVDVQTSKLIIPAIDLDQPIYEGTDTYAELAKGVWHWPGSSTPVQGGNTVLLGHRFTYTTPKGVFYFLDKVKIGDKIGVVWAGHVYTYRVDQTEVVSPSHTEILDPTAQPTLTVYTCTPTWWPVNRLVLIAHLEQRP